MLGKIIVIYCLFIITVGCRSVNDNIILTDDIDLGKVKAGTPVKLDIMCVNRNSRPVKLREISVSCSCLRARDEIIQKINPKDSLLLEFEYLPEGCGYVERDIRLYFNEFETPHIVRIFGRVYYDN